MRNVLFIFAGFDDGDVAWLASVGTTRHLAPGDVLVEQGRPVDDLFVVLQGEVVVEVAGAGVVARRGAGEIIGEMSFVDSAPPSATVRAGDPTIVFAVAKAVVAERLAANTGFAARFYRALALYLADRLREATARGRSADGAVESDLDELVLDGVSIAGMRFRGFIDTLAGAGRRNAL
ncbi:MAG: cyclic nucleotide-binding domain-containing protein [Siculibacillus sp.]|nr:cyclic nucleotide-binding domain-containing protein [Siculibacillus sp.]